MADVFGPMFLLKQIDITFLLKSFFFGDVFEPPSPGNTQKHDETEKKRKR
jgi:hypothetical protein